MRNETVDAALRGMAAAATPGTAPRLSRMDLLKMFGGIPDKFLQGYFAFKKKRGLKHEHTVDIRDVATWLGSTKSALDKTLRNKSNYTEGVDYVVSSGAVPGKHGGHTKLNVMMTFDAFRKLAMSSHAKKGNEVRSYFAAVEDLQDTYHAQFVSGLMADIARMARTDVQKRTNDGPGFLYIMLAARRGDRLFKIGRTIDIIARLAQYQTGKAADVAFEYVLPVPWAKEAERCMKWLLRGTRFKKRREIYEMDIDVLIRLARGCGGVGDVLSELAPEQLGTGGDDDRYYLAFLTPQQLEAARVARLKRDGAASPKKKASK